MNHNPEIIPEPNRDSLPDTLDTGDALTFRIAYRRLYGADEEWLGDANALELASNNALLESFDIDSNVRQLGQVTLIGESLQRADT
jgi:hypothetical protein